MIPSVEWLQERIAKYVDHNQGDITSTSLLAEYLHEEMVAVAEDPEGVLMTSLLAVLAKSGKKLRAASIAVVAAKRELAATQRLKDGIEEMLKRLRNDH